LLLAGLLLGGAQTSARTTAVSQTLHAQVGPSFQISLSFDDGSAVTNLPAGTYTVQVQDLSDQHNFHLFGPGVEQKTEIVTSSEATWTVTFQDQNGYSFQCDAHSSLTGNFTVGNLPAPQPVSTHAADATPLPAVPAAPQLPLKGGLQGTLGPGPKIGLLKGGKRVAKLARGIYQFSVADKSAKDGFTIRQVVGGTYSSELTAGRFVGKKTVSVELRPGKWKVYSTARESSVSAFFDVT
jgi:plastocyanin